MPIITRGRLGARPIGISTRLSLQEIASLLGEAEGLSDGAERGWGSVHDEPEYVGIIGRRQINVGRPRLFEAAGYAPDRVVARLYWWQLDRRAMKVVSENAAADSVQALEACDLVIAEYGTSGREYVCFVTSQQRTVINAHVVPALNDLLQAADSGATVTTENPPADIRDDDFFFWLMYKLHRAPTLTDDITILDILAVAGQDRAHRGAAIRDGVTLDRAELLAMIMGGATSFGPATVVVEDKKLDLVLDFEVNVDGGFSPNMSRTYYRRDEDSRLGREELGIRLIDDVAFRVVPEMKMAFNTDATGWGIARPAYVDDARQGLLDLIQKLLDR